MATLYNTRIADTYQGLIKTLDNGVLDSVLAEISDGSGNGTGVFLNTGGDLQATGIVSFGSLRDIGQNITILKFVEQLTRLQLPSLSHSETIRQRSQRLPLLIGL